METMGLGAGSYPEPSEKELKCYTFKYEGGVVGEGYVYAENFEKARELIESCNFEITKQKLVDIDFHDTKEE